MTNLWGVSNILHSIKKKWIVKLYRVRIHKYYDRADVKIRYSNKIRFDSLSAYELKL